MFFLFIDDVDSIMEFVRKPRLEKQQPQVWEWYLQRFC